MSELIDRQEAIVTAVRAAVDWHKLANPQYSIAYCIGEAMRQLPSAQPDLEAIKAQALTCSAELLKLVALISRHNREDEP